MNPRSAQLLRRRTGIGLIPVVLLVLILLASSLYPSSSVLAGGTTSISASGGNKAVGNNGTSTLWNAQGFQVYSGRLTSFSFLLSAKFLSPGDISWHIQSSTSSLPSGTDLATGTVTPNIGSDTTVTLGGSGPLLSASTLYYLVLHVTPAPGSGSYYRWQSSVVSVYDWGMSAVSSNDGATWTAAPTNDCNSSFTTTDDTPTPSLTYTPSATLTPSNTPTGTLTPSPTYTPSDTPTYTITPSPSLVYTWTPTPTPNLMVILTLTTGQQVAVKYEITAGDAMTASLLVMLLCFSIFGVFLQTRRRRLQ